MPLCTTCDQVAMEDLSDEAWDAHISSVLSTLQKLYKERVLPVETKCSYEIFRPSWFAETIKQRAPFVTFLGPFSSGKSSFINYLLQDETLLLTGPQPVTDKFNVIMYGESVRQVPGRVLMADARLPFRGLGEFGDSFAEGLQGTLAPHPILRYVTLVDTPGVLEASSDIRERRYDYVRVCSWFIERSDLIFFLFDPTKLDAGPELRFIFERAIRGRESKVRIILNKADTISPNELVRVYGALYWNLANLIHSTEPPRVYVSSFWDRPYRAGTDHVLFTKEKEDLLYELLETVPLQSVDRRVTALLCRAEAVLIFALVCAAFRSSLPRVFGRAKAKLEFIVNYDATITDLAAKYHLSVNNFPSSTEMQQFFAKIRAASLPDFDELKANGWLVGLRKLIGNDLPKLLQPIKQHALANPHDRKQAIMLQRQYKVGQQQPSSPPQQQWPPPDV